MASPTQSQGQGIDISTLPLQQLSQLQSRISSELEHLSTSYQRLRAAQSRFRDCIRSIKDGVESKSTETPLLIPLTTSLYIPSTLQSNSTVLVDVGTGFYVEKSTSDAKKFYDGKVAELDQNMKEIENAVEGKTGSLRMVEDVMRQKVVMERGQEGGGGSAT